MSGGVLTFLDYLVVTTMDLFEEIESFKYPNQSYFNAFLGEARILVAIPRDGFLGPDEDTRKRSMPPHKER